MVELYQVTVPTNYPLSQKCRILRLTNWCSKSRSESESFLSSSLFTSRISLLSNSSFSGGVSCSGISHSVWSWAYWIVQNGATMYSFKFTSLIKWLWELLAVARHPIVWEYLWHIAGYMVLSSFYTVVQLTA